MNRRQIANLLVLREVGIEPKLDLFRDRLAVQKTVYLAQAAGLDLGYHFGWYIRGPYCSAVAKDMFAAIADPDGIDDAFEQWALDETSIKQLRRVRKMRPKAACGVYRPLRGSRGATGAGG
jgi:uncharacterized protein YwgA